MSAISLSSFSSYRPSQGVIQSSPQRSGNTYGSFSGISTSRGNSPAYNAGSSSAYCPTCGGGAFRSAVPTSSSYCPNCNRSGGSQSNVTFANQNAVQSGQGGRTCIACAYQGR